MSEVLEQELQALHPLAFIVYDKYLDVLESIYYQDFTKITRTRFFNNLEMFILNKNSSIYTAIMEKYGKDCKEDIEIYFKETYGEENLANYTNEIEEETIACVQQMVADNIRKEVIRAKFSLYKIFVNYRFIAIDSSDNVLATEQFKKVKDFYDHEKESSLNHTFHMCLGKLILPVKQKDLEEFENNFNFNKKNKINITIPQLEKISHLVYSLKLMAKQGITSANYDKKVINSYNTLKKNAFDNFGIVMSEQLPFENPSSLIEKIDKILFQCNFTQEQKKDFLFFYLEGRKLPVQNHINDEKLKRLRLLYDSLPSLERFSILRFAGHPSLTEHISADGQKFISELYRFANIDIFQTHLEANLDMMDERTYLSNQHLVDKLKEDELLYNDGICKNIDTLFMNPKNIKSEISNLIKNY